MRSRAHTTLEFRSECVLVPFWRGRTVEEGDELIPGALGAQGDGDRGQPTNRVQAQLYVLVLQLVDQHGHWVQRVLLIGLAADGSV